MNENPYVAPQTVVAFSDDGWQPRRIPSALVALGAAAWIAKFLSVILLSYWDTILLSWNFIVGYFIVVYLLVLFLIGVFSRNVQPYADLAGPLANDEPAAEPPSNA